MFGLVIPLLPFYRCLAGIHEISSLLGRERCTCFNIASCLTVKACTSWMICGLICGHEITKYCFSYAESCPLFNYSNAELVDSKFGWEHLYYLCQNSCLLKIRMLDFANDVLPPCFEESLFLRCCYGFP